MTLESPIIFYSDSNDLRVVITASVICLFRVVMPANSLRVGQLRFCGTSRDVQ